MKAETAEEVIKQWQGQSSYLHEDDAIGFAKDYARIQIEKDRERVKDQIWHSDDIHNTINEVIDNTPIVLD